MCDSTNAPVIGETWTSNDLNRTFLVLSGPEATYGKGDWSRSIFVGHRAVDLQLSGTPTKDLALVGLTKKPLGYPYDFVLL